MTLTVTFYLLLLLDLRMKYNIFRQYIAQDTSLNVQRMRLALSVGPNRVGLSLPSPEDENIQSADLWMLRHVALVRTDVSEECISSIIGMARTGEPGITLAIRSTLRGNTLEVIRFSETSVPTRATCRNVPEDGVLHSYHRETLRSFENRCSFRNLVFSSI
jgi:hypothetical protein